MSLLTERYDWVDAAPCRGAWPVFDAADDSRAAGYAKALADARAMCMRCPARVVCAVTAIEEEWGSVLQDRYSVRGALTQHQRLSIERRGGLKEGHDPLKVVRGEYGNAPIPDIGDRWTRHHTTLARKVVAWLVDHVEVGGPLPSQEVLAETLDCSISALRRVMEVLVEDGTVALAEPGPRTATKYVRQGNPRVVSSWLPPHMRTVARRSRES